MRLELSQAIRALLWIVRQIRALLLFIFTGRLIVWLSHHIVLTAGTIAESALLFASLWVTSVSVVPELTHLLGGAEAVLTSLAMMIFSLLPEIILFSAIITTWKHWHQAITQKRPASWFFAVLFTVPTITFLVMTIVTISSLAATRSVQHATGAALVIRCLSGWSYALISMLADELHQSPASVIQKSAPVPPVPAPVPPIDHAAIARELAPMIQAMISESLARLPAPAPVDLDVLVDLIVQRVAPTTDPLPALDPVSGSGSTSTTIMVDPVGGSGSGTVDPVGGSGASSAGGSGTRARASRSTRVDPEPVVQVAPDPSRSTTRPDPEPVDMRLKTAYEALLAEGAVPSGRLLSARVKCHRSTASDWLRSHRSGSESSGSTALGGSGSTSSGSTGSGTVDLASDSTGSSGAGTVDPVGGSGVTESTSTGSSRATHRRGSSGSRASETEELVAMGM